MTFDPTQALLVICTAAAVIGALHVFEIWAERHVRERTRRALDRVTAERDHDRDVT